MDASLNGAAAEGWEIVTVTVLPATITGRPAQMVAFMRKPLDC
jgi:hypothetical protein